MSKTRNATIDFLRGLAVILMILIHTTAYFLDRASTRIIWDYTHFAVPLFVFCSIYLAFQRKNAGSLSISQILRRLQRLIIPYYIFVSYLLLVFVFILDKKITIQYIFEQFLFGMGRDVGWLVVLFVYILFLIPLIRSTYDRMRPLFWLLVFSSFISSLLIMIYPIDYSFRQTMWLPWILFLIYTYWFVKYKNKAWFPFCVIILSLIGFIIARFILIANGQSLVFIENKYPPNLYYLSYGIMITTLLYYFHRLLTKKNLFAHWLQNIFKFFSIYSYSLFFIHFIFVYILKDRTEYQRLGWWGFFIVILVLSVITQILINTVQKKLQQSFSQKNF